MELKQLSENCFIAIEKQMIMILQEHIVLEKLFSEIDDTTLEATKIYQFLESYNTHLEYSLANTISRPYESVQLETRM